MLIDRYDWAGGSEAMLRFGPATGPTVIAALPLFEEANRTRTFVVGLLRRLAAKGIGGALPDLPGTGESEVATVNANFADWRAAFDAAAATLPGPVFGIAIRGGALIDAQAELAGRWRLSPSDGKALNREWRHAQIMAEAARGNRVTLADLDRAGPPLTVAGNLVSQALLFDLEAAEVAPGRVVALTSSEAEADCRVAGTVLWRRAEPGNDPLLAQMLTDDIADWIATCAD